VSRPQSVEPGRTEDPGAPTRALPVLTRREQTNQAVTGTATWSQLDLGSGLLGRAVGADAVAEVAVRQEPVADQCAAPGADRAGREAGNHATGRSRERSRGAHTGRAEYGRGAHRSLSLAASAGRFLAGTAKATDVRKVVAIRSVWVFGPIHI
jgi:hypothetical protein